MKKSKKTLIAVILLIVLAAAFALVWHFCGPASMANDADKTISVTVIHGDGSEKDFTINTDEEYLRGALEQEKLIEGSDGEYGLFITAVDGETADSSLEQWWSICGADGNMLSTGVEDTAISDGDSYTVKLITGYDQY